MRRYSRSRSVSLPTSALKGTKNHLHRPSHKSSVDLVNDYADILMSIFSQGTLSPHRFTGFFKKVM